MSKDNIHDKDEDPDAGEKPKFKSYFKKKQYNIIEDYFEKGRSVPWYLRWHHVTFVIDTPHFYKRWPFAERKVSFSLATPKHEKISDATKPENTVEQAKTTTDDERIVKSLLEEIEFKDEEKPVRLLTGRGRISNKIKIGLIDLKEGEKTGWLGGYGDAELNIHEGARVIGHIWHATGYQLKFADRDDPYLSIECYIPVGTLDAVRDEYLSAEGQRIVIDTLLLLWEWDVQAAFGEPYQTNHLHLEKEGSSYAFVSSITVTTEQAAPRNTEGEEESKIHAEEPRKEASEMREIVQRLYDITKSIVGLTIALWIVGALVFLAVIFIR